MIPKSTSQFKQFRQAMYEAFEYRRDALMELVDALSSTRDARSVVELSMSPFFRREYPSLYDAITSLFQPSKPEEADEERREWEKKWMRLIAPYLPSPKKREFWLFGIDVVPIPRLFSPTLPDRTFVYQPNMIKENKPVTIGHQYSHLVFFPEKFNTDDAPWTVPLIVRRIHSDEKATTLGAEQIDALMKDKALPWHNELCVIAEDSTYSAMTHLGPVMKQKHKDLVVVTRARSNRVFYRQPPVIDEEDKLPGHPTWYGERFDLKDHDTWGEPDEVTETVFSTRSGRHYRAKLEGWHNLLMTGTYDWPMHQHPFTLIRVRVLDEAGNPVFKRTMWLIVIGKRRHELSIQQAWEAYGQRYDVEHYFRFGKQRLLERAYQTSDDQHEENWMHIVALAKVQLWLARDLAKSLPRPWERYLPEIKRKTPGPSFVQRDLGRIIRQIGTPALPPKARGNSPGRAKGEKQLPRKRHPVIKKSELAPDLA